MKEFLHYGDKIYLQDCNPDIAFDDFLDQAYIDFVFIPYIHQEVKVVKYAQGETERYAVYSDKNVVICDAPPVDGNWYDVFKDALGQENGEEPMLQRSRLGIIVDKFTEKYVKENNIPKVANLKKDKKYLEGLFAELLKYDYTGKYLGYIVKYQRHDAWDVDKELMGLIENM